MHLHFRQVALIFRRRIGHRAHHIAKIIERESGHDGVQINHANAFAGHFIEQHVVDLGIVVRDAFRQICVEHHAANRLMTQGEFNFPFRRCRPIAGVGGNRFFQCAEAFGRVMKIRNRLVQARRGQIRELFLEYSKRLARRECLRQRLDHIHRARPFDERKHAPPVSVGVAVK